MSHIVELLRAHHALILDWARSLTHEQMASHDFGGWLNGQLLTPLFRRNDLMSESVRQVLSHPDIRQVIFIDVKPRSGIPNHRHLEMSHYQVLPGGRVQYFPFRGDFFRVTHFVVSAPEDRDNAFMYIRGGKHHWRVGEFEEFDVIRDYHHVVNNTDESVRMLYVEYYRLGERPPVTGEAGSGVTGMGTVVRGAGA